MADRVIHQRTYDAINDSVANFQTSLRINPTATPIFDMRVATCFDYMVGQCGLGTLYDATGEREQSRSALATAVEMYHAMDMAVWLLQTAAALAQEWTPRSPRCSSGAAKRSLMNH